MSLSCLLPREAQNLIGSRYKVGTVVGFPHGISHIRLNQPEVNKAKLSGAIEMGRPIIIGTVINNRINLLGEDT